MKIMQINRKNANTHFFILMLSTSIYLSFLDYYNSENPRQSHFWNMSKSLNESETYPLVIFCIMSYMAGYFVLNYHVTTPTHPKFAFTTQRKIILAIHIFSGYIEMLAFLVGFFSSTPSLWAYIAIIAACVGHIPTSIYLWPSVYGIKKLMIPCYFISIATHIYITYTLFQHPSDPMALLKMCIALHLYVWVRVSIRLFQYLQVFQENEYTLAVFFAGFLTIPLILGVLGNFIFPISILLYNCAIDPVLQYFGISPDQKSIDSRNTYESNNDNKNDSRYPTFISTSTIDGTPFSNTNNNNSSRNQLINIEYKRDIKFLMKSSISNSNNDINNTGIIKNEAIVNDENSFKSALNSQVSLTAAITTTSASTETVSDEHAASVVFQALDVSNCGYLKLSVLINILKEFGLSDTDIMREKINLFHQSLLLLSSPSSSTSSSLVLNHGRIGNTNTTDCAKTVDIETFVSLDCFTKEWRCIWEYAYHQLRVNSVAVHINNSTDSVATTHSSISSSLAVLPSIHAVS